MMIEYTLPFPPSANQLFAGKARRYVSPRYKAWKREASWAMHLQRVGYMAGPVKIDIALTAPDKRQRDADNLIKAVLDLAVSQHVLPGDSRQYVKGVSAYWSDEPGKAGARVRIMPA